MSKLSLISCPSYESSAVAGAVKKALTELGGMEQFVRPGQKVLLKVSLLTGVHPDRAITTHPALVEAVVREVLRVGGIPYIGDMPANNLVDINEIFRVTGLAAVASDTGAHLTSLKKGGVHRTRLNNKTVPEVLLATEVLEADVIINLPKLKTHTLTLLTGAVKNIYGTVSGFNKSRYHFLALHPVQFSRLLVDIYEVVKPRLTIMDAVVAMEGDGPANGTPRTVGAILASADGVAVDCLAAEIMGYKPNEIMTTRLAAERNLGIGQLSGIQILGEALEKFKIKDFKKPRNLALMFKAVPIQFFGLVRIINWIVTVVPEIKADVCNSCGNCARHCPVLAIVADQGEVYFINQKKCIQCFCCSEVCPVQAVNVRRNWLGRLLTQVKS